MPDPEKKERNPNDDAETKTSGSWEQATGGPPQDPELGEQTEREARGEKKVE